jgi:hypothetical protein
MKSQEANKKTWYTPQNGRFRDDITSIGLGSKERVTPAISVILCITAKTS